MPKRFEIVQTSDRILQTIQSNIASSVNELARLPELNSSSIEVATVASTDIIVNHLLNRNIQGYYIERSNADVRVWESATTNNSPTKQLILRASGTATITLKIY